MCNISEFSSALSSSTAVGLELTRILSVDPPVNPSVLFCTPLTGWNGMSSDVSVRLPGVDNFIV